MQANTPYALIVTTTKANSSVQQKIYLISGKSKNSWQNKDSQYQ